MTVEGQPASDFGCCRLSERHDVQQHPQLFLETQALLGTTMAGAPLCSVEFPSTFWASLAFVGSAKPHGLHDSCAKDGILQTHKSRSIFMHACAYVILYIYI